MELGGRAKEVGREAAGEGRGGDGGEEGKEGGGREGGVEEEGSEGGDVGAVRHGESIRNGSDRPGG